jgi:hypothetical protein
VESGQESVIMYVQKETDKLHEKRRNKRVFISKTLFKNSLDSFTLCAFTRKTQGVKELKEHSKELDK